MAEVRLSPGARLDALEKQAQAFLMAHVELEVKTAVLDQVLGFLMGNGVKPSPEQLAGMWQASAKAVQEKFPGVQFQMKVEAPKLILPTNGQLHRVN